MSLGGTVKLNGDDKFIHCGVTSAMLHACLLDFSKVDTMPCDFTRKFSHRQKERNDMIVS